MKLTDLWKRGEPTVSFELFPVRDEKAAGKLEGVIEKLAAAKPDFVSVTFGAGGSTRQGSCDLVKQLLGRKLEVLAYFTCYGLGPDDIASALDAYRDLGVENVLAARGDAPREDEAFRPHPESLPHASDLLAFVRPKYSFCLGAAGYPEGHVKAESKERDLEYAKLKVEKGADFIITNYCYDNAFYFDYVERARAIGIEVPILPGVMPIFSVKMTAMLGKLCGATITDEVQRGLAALPEGDKDALAAFGIDFAVEQCRGLLEAGVPGLHIYTMDRSKAPVAIMKRLREEKLL